MEELIPFKGRNCSYAIETNLLTRIENIYLMDNHRMAAWCWSQNFDLDKKYTIVHIDKHYDTSTHYQLDIYCQNIKKNLNNYLVEEYDKLDYEYDKNQRSPIFTWDNYIPIFHKLYGNCIKEYMFFTQEQGEFWNEISMISEHYSSFNLINNFSDYFNLAKDNLIVNLDLDYFFSDYPKYQIIFSDSAIKEIFGYLNDIAKIKRNIITISLSPECCGGWANSVDFINKFGEFLGFKPLTF